MDVDNLWTTFMNHLDFWNKTKDELKKRLPAHTFDTWFEPIEMLGVDTSKAVLQVPNQFFSEWVETHYSAQILNTINELGVKTNNLKFVVSGEDLHLETDQKTSNGSVATKQAKRPRHLNAAYVFEGFIEGPNNQFAKAAAQKVAKTPGSQSFNPLVIYGGVGLGKTHLLHAIGQASSDVGLTSLYVSSEQFTNEYIISIRNGTAEQFRNKYRSVEVLLIDDIQFLSGKEQTQEGFFHTFNDLHNSGQQIVIASDRPPRALALLQDRLRSRFEWGLMADIQAPDLETRMAILSSKAASLELDIEDSIIEFIAKRVQKNVRELEGSLNRVVAYSDLMNIPVTIELAVNVLQDLATDAARHSIDPDKIIDQVSKYFGIEAVDILGRRRTKIIALSRQIVMYLLSYELEMSPTQIGRILGGRDHATVIHGAGKINAEINEDHQLRQDVLTIKESLFA